MRFYYLILLLTILYSCHEKDNDKPTPVNVPVADTNKVMMNDTLKNEVLSMIDISVQSGFLDKEDMMTDVEDYLSDVSYDHDWAQKEIKNTYGKWMQSQTGWPAITDFDKLVKAFDKLYSSGIVALHNAGMTKQDGEGDTREIHDDLLQEGVQTRGYCYYHWQDIERVVDDGQLYIGFGDFDNDDKKALIIGKEVVAALTKQGFSIQWDGTVQTRILVTGINWQKRPGNDNCSYEHAEKLLSRK